MSKLLRIKEILKEKGLSLNELADILGVHRVTLSNQVNGNPTVETLQSIADALDVNISELFYVINTENITITNNEYNNVLVYDDEHIFLQVNLPHFTNGDFGTCLLSFKKYNFSIVPKLDDLFEFVFSDKNIEREIFMGDYKESVNVQLFSTFTTLRLEEHRSFLVALKHLVHYYKESYQEILIRLGAIDYQRVGTSNYFKLCTVSREDWIRLMKLSKKYDLDQKQNDFYVFDARGESIRIYNEDYTEPSNTFKTWIVPVDEASNDYEVVLAWKSPAEFARRHILSKELLTAHETYSLLQEKLLPKARKLFKKV